MIGKQESSENELKNDIQRALANLKKVPPKLTQPLPV